MNKKQLNQLAALTVLCVAVRLTGCGGSDEATTPAPAPSPTPSPTPSPAPAPSPAPTSAPSPAPAPASADSGACFNDAMAASGARWKVAFRDRGLGGDADGITRLTELLGTKTFNGQAANEYRLTTSQPGKPTTVQWSYSQLTSQNFVQFGWRFAGGVESYIEPGLATPRVLQAGQSSTSTFTTRMSDGSAPAATTRLTTTYLGSESLTVPAGTFETCKAKFVDQTGATSLTWTVASGPYRGLDIRFATLNALNGSTLWFSEATSIEANLQ